MDLIFHRHNRVPAWHHESIENTRSTRQQLAATRSTQKDPTATVKIQITKQTQPPKTDYLK
jgi:hypothetical protein